MTATCPILVTGAAGSVGAVGRTIVELLRKKDFHVRAMVRREDERSKVLHALGAEVVVGDLTNPVDVVKALHGCRRVYFGMSVSAPYLEATVIMAAAALKQANLEVLVNISQLTVSQMSLTNMTDSSQQRQHWLAEQALNWSGLPVVHVRPTIFLDHFFFTTWAAETIAKNGIIRLPFGFGRTSPIAAEDVARVIATILAKPELHIGKLYELTGPRSQDMFAIAKEYADALNRPVRYLDVPFDQWQREVAQRGLPEHVSQHFVVMAKLHAQNRYDRMTDDVLKVTGTAAMSVKDFIKHRTDVFSKLYVQKAGVK
jgi:NAD(P)H dehydrogenase (quinone)